jgi:hypothetical protein
MTFTRWLAQALELGDRIGRDAVRNLYLGRPSFPHDAAGTAPDTSPIQATVLGDHVNPDKLSAHLRVDHYGDFVLTDAIRPSVDLRIVPRQGFRIEVYRDRRAGLEVPVLAAAISKERLFDLFLELLQPLGDTVDVVLETSHDSEGNGHRDLHREQVELPVLMSHFCDFEDLLLNDGCTGVAVISNSEPMEVQFDEHKLLVVYARDLEPFERILRQSGIERDDDMKLITEGEHLHSTDPHHGDAFEQLCYRLGIGETAEKVNW